VRVCLGDKIAVLRLNSLTMSPILPIGIESALKEAGFAPTEIQALKKLVEEDALTIRELATKTGKSTGVLDQAMKKLLTKGIARREVINGQPRYSIHSLDAIVGWMKEDVRSRHETLDRRHHDFESFITSLKMDRSRPDMEYFEGEEGIRKAYVQLLGLLKTQSFAEEETREFLHYRPAMKRDEDDPLHAFKVQYFRERHRRGIFTRALVPNTPLGRRIQSRDPFEYRKTQLIEEDVFPITFEKIIAGDTVACFNPGANRACFLRFPELAAAERAAFETFWRRAEGLADSLPPTAARPTVAPDIPLGTRALSSLREFFLSRKSLALLGIFAIAAAAITFGLYRQNVYLNTQRIRERAISIAATAAPGFDVKDIDQLHTAEDVKKPEFMKLVDHLRLIRSQNENVKWVYIDRPTGMVNPAWEVVADADYGTPDIDLNGDGKIEEWEQLTMPGQKYPHADPYQNEILKRPFSVLIRDEWGEYFDATAPIFDSQGKAVAALFVDVDLQEVYKLTRQTFIPIYYFLGFFLLFILVRFAAFNPVTLREAIGFLRRRKRTLAH